MTPQTCRSGPDDRQSTGTTASKSRCGLLNWEFSPLRAADSGRRHPPPGKPNAPTALTCRAGCHLAEAELGRRHRPTDRQPPPTPRIWQTRSASTTACARTPTYPDAAFRVQRFYFTLPQPTARQRVEG
ncbi:hypothetical protein J4732_03900 [Serratia marcescens]|uniref:Uncharacterized protein n=1 Tax=Serratia marcescens TaxID=615 RepID=A0A939NPI9_SERMA|nr:hypothetical protein [Serratia marcescens]